MTPRTYAFVLFVVFFVAFGMTRVAASDPCGAPTLDCVGEIERWRLDEWAQAQDFGPVIAYWQHRAWAEAESQSLPRVATPQPKTPAPVSVPRPATGPEGGPTADQWAALRHCEATGNYQAVNPSGKYRGAYQFDQATWESVGGTGDPAAASPAEQDLRAQILYSSRGRQPWPQCGRFLP